MAIGGKQISKRHFLSRADWSIAHESDSHTVACFMGTFVSFAYFMWTYRVIKLTANNVRSM